jgi:hypothetical protein
MTGMQAGKKADCVPPEPGARRESPPPFSGVPEFNTISN